MADLKISELTNLTAADPANDMIPIVDVSATPPASGSTKRISINNILACSPTATLASATITGDLTVDTSTLKVDSANNRVGIGTASPTTNLHVGSGVGLNNLGVGLSRGATTNFYEAFDGTKSFLAGTDSSQTGVKVGALSNHSMFLVCNNITQLQIDPLGVFTFGDGAGGTRMTLNSTGLGVGVAPSAWGSGFRYVQAGPGCAYGTNGSVDRTDVAANWYYNGGDKYINATGKASIFQQSGGAFFWLSTNTASGGAGSAMTLNTNMTLDASGNLLVGTTGLNGSWNTKLTLSNDSGTTKWAVGPYLGGVTNFLISAGASAGVYLNGTAATSWTSASDERLKDIIEPISDAIAKVGSLRAVIGKFKFDENNTRKPFLIAQDIQAVLPEAVDASNPDKLGVAYTDVIPLLVAAIKELTAEVNALKNA